MSVQKKPNGKWEVRFRDENERNRSRTFTRKGDADSFDRQVKTNKERGELINPDRSSMTVGQFYRDVFLPSRGTVVHNTRRGYRVRWAGAQRNRPWHVAQKWENVKLRDANNREAVVKWHEELRKAGATPSQLFRAHDLFMAIMGVAEEFEYLPRLRVRNIDPGYKAKRKGAVWMPEQIEQLHDTFLAIGANPKLRTGNLAVYRWRKERDAALVRFAGYHPMRTGEWFALKWTTVLVDGRIAPVFEVEDRVPGVDEDDEQATKNGEPRVVELLDVGRVDLRDWWMRNGRPRTGLVFPYNPDGTGWTASRIKNWRKLSWFPAVEAVGLPAEKPKHLRHSAVSMRVRASGDIAGVARMAGHTPETLMRVYLHALRLAMTEPWKMEEAIRAARNPDVRRRATTG